MSSLVSMNVPPHFARNNYAYWKVRMRAFFMSINEDTWEIVETGWERPKTKLTMEDKVPSKANNKAFNVIFFWCVSRGV